MNPAIAILGKAAFFHADADAPAPVPALQFLANTLSLTGDIFVANKALTPAQRGAIFAKKKALGEPGGNTFAAGTNKPAGSTPAQAQPASTQSGTVGASPGALATPANTAPVPTGPGGTAIMTPAQSGYRTGPSGMENFGTGNYVSSGRNPIMAMIQAAMSGHISHNSPTQTVQQPTPAPVPVPTPLPQPTPVEPTPATPTDSNSQAPGPHWNANVPSTNPNLAKKSPIPATQLAAAAATVADTNQKSVKPIPVIGPSQDSKRPTPTIEPTPIQKRPVPVIGPTPEPKLPAPKPETPSPIRNPIRLTESPRDKTPTPSLPSIGKWKLGLDGLPKLNGAAKAAKRLLQ